MFWILKEVSNKKQITSLFCNMSLLKNKKVKQKATLISSRKYLNISICNYLRKNNLTLQLSYRGGKSCQLIVQFCEIRYSMFVTINLKMIYL